MDTLWSRLKRFISSLFHRKSSLSGLLAQLPDERLQGILCQYLEGPEVPTQAVPATKLAPKEQDTGGIDERAVEKALKDQRKSAPITDKIHAMPLDTAFVEDLVKRLPPGELALAWWDSHREGEMGDETRMFRVTRRKTGKLREER
jgi:hypothetical protein